MPCILLVRYLIAGTGVNPIAGQWRAYEKCYTYDLTHGFDKSATGRADVVRLEFDTEFAT